jgi:hypothetical protein
VDRPHSAGTGQRFAKARNSARTARPYLHDPLLSRYASSAAFPVPDFLLPSAREYRKFGTVESSLTLLRVKRGAEKLGSDFALAG